MIELNRFDEKSKQNFKNWDIKEWKNFVDSTQEYYLNENLDYVIDNLEWALDIFKSIREDLK
jgi:hypothetical protein